LQNELPPVALSIAEFDPSGRSGTVSDVRTFAAHNCYGVAAVTAMVLLQAESKPRLHATASQWLKETLFSLFKERQVRAVKIGMLCGRAHVEAVCEVLDHYRAVPVVVDPDLRGMDSPPGKETGSADVLRSLLIGRATVVTPNSMEAAALTGLQVQSAAEMKAAAAKLIEFGARSVVVAGGMFEKPFDIYFDHEVSETLAGECFKVEAPYGPGSTFSSAIAANLALGRQPHDAVVMAKAFVTEALRKGYTTPAGTVLLNQFYRTQQMPRIVETEPAASERSS
jgi:hydroxymethylpyrimidine/phosphomethylpyrimidine kinase